MSQDFASLTMSVSQKGFEQAKKRAEELSRATRDLVREFDGLQKSQGDTSKATEQGAAKTEKATHRQEQFQKELTRSSGRLKVIGRDINRYLVLPLTAFIGVSARAALELNRGMSAVQTLIPDTGERINDLRDGVVDLAQQTGRSMNDLTDGLYQTVSAFQDNEDTMDRLRVATEMSLAGFSSTTEAVNLLASVTRAYGDTSAEATLKVSDLAFETVRLGVTTIPQLSSAMQVATDRAVRLGVSQEELFATMATLTGITGDASMVATQFRSAMDSLLNPTNAMIELLDELGYASAQAAIDQMGMVGVLDAINRASEQTGRPLQDYITRKEGVTLVSRLATQQMEAYNERLEAMTTAHGASNRALRTAQEGIGEYNFALNKARERISTLMAEIGQNMLPSLVVLATAVADIVEAFSLLPDSIQASLVGLTAFSAFAAIFFQLLGVLKSMATYALPGVITQMGTIVIAGKSIATIMAGVMGTLSGILAITGLIAAAMVRQNREIADAAREAEMRMDRLESTASRTTRAISQSQQQSALEAQIRGSGQLPDLPDGRQLSLEDLEGFSQQQRQAVLEQYKSQLDSLITDMENASSTSVSRMQRNLSDVASRINNYLNDKWIEEMFIQTAGAGDRRQRIKDIFEKDLSDTVRDLEIIKIFEEELRALEEHYDVEDGVLAPDFDRVNVNTQAGAQALLGLNKAQERYDTLTQAVSDFQTHLEDTQALTAHTESLRETEREINSIRAAIEIMTETYGDLDDLVSDKMRWQEWFAQVTEIEEAEFVRTGQQAARLYREAWEDELTFEMDLADFFGMDHDAESALKQRVADIVEDLRELMTGIPDDEIDFPFLFTDRATLDMLSEYRDRLQELTELQAGDFIRSFRDSKAEMEHFNTVMVESGMVADALNLSTDEMIELLREAENHYVSLHENGISETASIMEELRDIMDSLGISIAANNDDIGYTSEQVKELNEDLDDLTNRLMTGRLGFFSYRDAVQELLEGFEDLETEAELIIELFEEMADTMLHAGVDMLADSMFDLGEAFGRGSLGADSFVDAMAQMGLQIAQLIPQLMIAAGLQLLIFSGGTSVMGWALLGTGMAGMFAAGALTGYYEESKSPSAKGNVFESGNIVPYADGGILHRTVSFPLSDGSTGVAGEAGPEAIMPLTRMPSGDLGVKASGGGESVQIEFTVVNNSSVPVKEEVTEETGSDGIRRFTAVIEDVVDGGIARGRFNGSLGSKYGLSPRGVRVG